MGEHVVARPPASAATTGPAWPPVTATGPVRVLAANCPGAPQPSPIAVPPETLLLSLPGSAARTSHCFRQGPRCWISPLLLAARSRRWRRLRLAEGLKSNFVMGAKCCRSRPAPCLAPCRRLSVG